MEQSESKTLPTCPSPEISAYIDGELSAQGELQFEMHVAYCRTCNDDLNLQKSFLNALDTSLDGVDDIRLPSNFTKSVVANAESRVNGLRRPHERRNAALICVALIVFSLFALGSNAQKSFVAMAAVADKFFAVAAASLHFVYDIALGSAIVFRSLASSFVFGSTTAVLFLLVAFVLSLFLFSKLLVRFHRT